MEKSPSHFAKIFHSQAKKVFLSCTTSNSTKNGGQIMAKKQPTLGQRLNARRIEQGKTQAEIANAARISASYYCEIENSKCIPPPRLRLSQILIAVGFCDSEARELEKLAAEERGGSHDDADLPEDIQTLIQEIRKHANEMNPRFIRGLRTKIREAVS